MKKIISFLVLLPVITLGQTTTENYVKTTTYKQPTTVSNSSISVSNTEVTYFDGLGRPKQKISGQMSPTGKSIVTPIEYDAFGRPEKQFLSYKSTATGLNIESNNVLSFYGSPTELSTGNPAFEATTNPFTQKQFEPSPLGRVLKIAAPGNPWAIAENHTISLDYIFNTTGDQVKLFKVTTVLSGNLYVPTLVNFSGNTFYPANSLNKTIIKDENWKTSDGLINTIQEFTNDAGNVVLRRTYGTSVVDYSETTTVHDTYYVYDVYGNLTYVIPPAADGVVSALVLENLCYQYKYDFKNRLVEKKLPGKDWEFIVYDKLDRPLAVGPTYSPFGNPQNAGWLISKHDINDRIVYTGWYNGKQVNSTERNAMQILLDDTDALASETRGTPIPINNINVGYTNAVFPTSSMALLSVNYYDNYTYPNALAIPTVVLADGSQAVYYNNTNMPQGLLTNSWTRALTSEGEFSGTSVTIFYDKKAKAVRTHTLNYLGGYTQVDRKIDFSGKVLKQETKHKRSASDTEVSYSENFTYSDQERLLTHTHQMNTGSMPVEVLSNNSYDEIGQLISKKVGGSLSAPLQDVNYAYNARGWLTNINDITPRTNPAGPTDLFAFKINYNTVQNLPDYTGTPMYNGNISETYWRSSPDLVLRKYGYRYDGMNRLRDAVYQRPENSTLKVTKAYNEHLTYDKNGNIMSLIRNGDFDPESVAPIKMDELYYTYKDDNVSNRLATISETAAAYSTLGFKKGNTTTADDYQYDSYGNLTTDLNKGITTPIRYNHLNLPVEIIFSTSPLKKIEYIYDANGNKLLKKVTNGSTITTTDYLDTFQYKKTGTQAAVLQFFSTSEGYVNYDARFLKYRYVYNYTDHLGNIRLSYAYEQDAPNGLTILEQSHYYPLGMKHTNYNVGILRLRGDGSETVTLPDYKYKFNGKEYQDELDLKTFDFGARQYDPAIGRWMNMDAQSESFRSVSPYTYAYNNPIFFIDSNGKAPTPFEAALMALHVYNNSGVLLGGWQQSYVSQYNINNKSTGLQGTMYERIKADGVREYAYVYAGTTDLKDWENNGKQALGQSRQYEIAANITVDMSAWMGDNELTFIGHSLGGGLSNFSSYVTGRSSMSFNAAWVSGLTKDNVKQRTLRTGNSRINFVHERDPLTRLQDKYGKKIGLQETSERYTVEGDFFPNFDITDPFYDHSMEEMIDRMFENGEATQHVGNKDDKYIEVSQSPRYW